MFAHRWRQKERNKMIYINCKKAVRTIAAAAGIEGADLVEIRLSDENLTAVYTAASNKKDVNVPCEWYVYIYDKRNALKIVLDEIEVYFNL